MNENTRFGEFTVGRKLSRHHDGEREVYHVVDEQGEALVLTVFNLNSERYASKEGKRKQQPDFIDEANFLKLTKGRLGVPSFVESGITTYRRRRYGWVSQRFFNGVPLDRLLAERGSLTQEETRLVISRIMDIVDAISRFTRGESYYNVTPANILLEYEDGRLKDLALTGLSNVKINGSGYAHIKGEFLDGRYRAPETLRGIYTQRSDVYSLGLLMLTMLCGQPDARNEGVEYNREVWKKASGNLPSNLNMILRKATDLSPAGRFGTVKRFQEFISRYTPSPSESPVESANKGMDMKTASKREGNAPNACHAAGRGGLDEVAGLTDLKALFRRDFISIVRNPQIARAYGIRPSNCTLLYGPQGCGKTFIAEKAALESGLKYKVVNPAELGSIYVHGSQQKIAETFAEAEKKGPMILIFDEFDALVPKRDSELNHNQSNEVNEMLTQMNNCADRGIYLICCTNRPFDLDPAILRKGRVDQSFFVPLPDIEARKELFRMELAKRPCVEGIDIEQLGLLTENYTCSDIAYIVAESARQCFEETIARGLEKPLPLSMEKLKAVSEATVPSVTEAQRKDFLAIKARMESRDGSEGRKIVGFLTKP